MNEKQKLAKIVALLDEVDIAYYEQIEPDNEYSELQAVWDEGYERCCDAIGVIKTLLDTKVQKHD